MIRIHRPAQPVAVLARLAVYADGVRVGRLRHGGQLDLHGSGRPQQISVRLDWMRSNVITVVDPGDDRMIVLTATLAPLVQTAFFSLFRPGKVLRLSEEWVR